MSRLFITLTVITSTLFTTQIPDQFDDTPKESGVSVLEQKKKSLGLGSFMRNSRNDASSQQYFNGNRHYMTSQYRYMTGVRTLSKQI